MTREDGATGDCTGQYSLYLNLYCCQGPRQIAPMITATLKARITLAYGCIYLVWGATYLGLAVAIQPLPPFTSGGVRFLLAAALMFAWPAPRDPARLRRPPPRPAP